MFIMREAIRKRYALLPFWYTMFYEHERNGAPVMRPMLSEFPLDKFTFKLDDQYMLSNKLMIKPVTEKGASEVKVYFPSNDAERKSGDRWYDFDYYEEFKDFLDRSPLGLHSFEISMSRHIVYQRGGSIIPKKETVEKSSAYMQNGPITLVIALNDERKAEGTLFIDDEKSYEYRDRKYLYLQFEYNHDTLTNKFIDKNANYSTKSLLERVVVTGADFIPKYATLNTTDGQSRGLEIFSNFNSRYFIIMNIDASLMDEWIITVSGATKTIVVGGNLIISIMVVNLSKYIFN